MRWACKYNVICIYILLVSVVLFCHYGTRAVYLPQVPDVVCRCVHGPRRVLGDVWWTVVSQTERGTWLQGSLPRGLRQNLQICPTLNPPPPPSPAPDCSSVSQKHGGVGLQFLVEDSFYSFNLRVFWGGIQLSTAEHKQICVMFGNHSGLPSMWSRSTFSIHFLTVYRKHTAFFTVGLNGLLQKNKSLSTSIRAFPCLTT